MIGRNAGTGAGALAVAAAGNDRESCRQSGRFGRLRGERAGLDAGCCQVRHLRPSDADGVQDFSRPIPLEHVERARGIRGRGGGGPVAGEMKGEIAVHFGNALGAGEHVGFDLAGPDHAIDRRHQVQWLAGNRVHAFGAECPAEAMQLGSGALVKPDHSGAQCPAVFGKEAEGFALIGDADRGNAPGIDLAGYLPERARGRTPPFRGILFEIAGCRVAHGDRDPALRDRTAPCIPGDRLGCRRRAVDSDDQVA